MQANLGSSTPQWVFFLITAVVPLVGVALGAILHYMFTRAAENKRHARQLRFDAYAAYIRSVGEMEQVSLLQRTDPSGYARAFVSAIEAKGRVCIHGSPDVVKALEAFEAREHGPGITQQRKERFAHLINTIRADGVAPGGPLDAQIINSILFAPQQ